ncbi:alginate lyase family protein [Pleomorphovibrio marinus]|uniref:alginate lyase family protein n=1 Tax=Pleomorphovibrio marinus TaxID=2164132 RepID=UPI000E0BE98E|nr:alginate lyase family protein [Pleomorphovibrio marinus]
MRLIPSSTLIICAVLFLLFSCKEKGWQDIHSIEDLVESHPEEVKSLFEHLDLQLPELSEVKQAYEEGRMEEACAKLLDYYRASAQNSKWKRPIPSASNETVAEVDSILENVFVIQNVRGQVPILSSGHRDWHYRGPNDDREWAWLSNRHSQLMRVYNAYLETGNEKYVNYLDEFLRDFIIYSMPYPAEKGRDAIWRGLEVAARVKAWTKIFYGLQESEHFNPATRLLMLISLPDHAHYNRNFHGGNNWLTMEISALATTAAYFPEFESTSEWLDYSVDVMVESMEDQVYPDGVQTELTAHYHNVSLNNFELFKEICEDADKALPDYFVQTIEDMYGYIAKAIRPSGHRPLNNDGDRGSDQALLLQGAELFGREDWKFVATNGKEGERPEQEPSYLLPWAGQLISRSGFEQDAHWSFFDIGPWGSGHQHNDKLHLSISAFGEDFLVDAGRFAYTGEIADKFRPYAKGSQGHNLLLIDGQGQGPGPTHATSPVPESTVRIEGDFDFATSSFEEFLELEGEVAHSRSMMYVRDKFWVVADRVVGSGEHSVETLWHWHPDCEVKEEENQITGSHQGGNLVLIPLGDVDFELQWIEGQEDPEIQGWYSPEYNVYMPNVANSYQTTLNQSGNLVWLLLPYQGERPRIQTQLLETNEKQVRVSVNVDEAAWELTLPFSDGRNASLKMLR